MFEAAQKFFEDSSVMMRLVISLTLVLLGPRLFQKFKLPGVLALIFVGVLFGPKGLRLFREQGQVLIMFATLGKLLLLFFSGLDIELDVLKKNLKKSALLAFYSFTLPALAGVLIGVIFDYSLMTCLMIGVLFSSHSVIGYPILAKLGLAKEEPVAVTIGATAITDISSLLFFAICLPIHTTGFSFGPFILQILYIVVFIPSMIFGFRWLGKAVFKRLGQDPAEQMIFLLLVVGISARVAELVNIEPIVGSFLAGLAVSTTLPNLGVRTQLDTLGNTLFIPSFFISLGVIIDPELVLQTVQEHFALTLLIILGVVSTKFLAAWLTARKVGYDTPRWVLIGSLTVPQVSSTLAVALVAYEAVNASNQRLIDLPLFNSILVLMVVSSVVGTVITEVTGARMLKEQQGLQASQV